MKPLEERKCCMELNINDEEEEEEESSFIPEIIVFALQYKRYEVFSVMTYKCVNVFVFFLIINHQCSLSRAVGLLNYAYTDRRAEFLFVE